MRRFVARLLRGVADAFDPPPPLPLTASSDTEAIEHDLLMPKYLYTSPLDYNLESHPPTFDAPILVPGEELPLPPPGVRAG
jgi:hypothetical protein